jgi:thioredoxin reductase (NADPH)
MSNIHHKIGIIGSGPAGWTAAIYTARANLDTTVFLGIQPGGQLTTTTEIENFPGFPEGIQGGDLMLNMQKQAERFGAKAIFSVIKGLEVKTETNKSKFLVDDGNVTHEFDAVIIASGASAKYLGIPGEEKFVGKGYHSCATCDGFFYRGKTIAIAGGGDSAMEEANFLTKFANKVYLIHRSEKFRASKIMFDRAKNNPKIEFITNKQIVSFLGSEKVEGVTMKDTVDNSVTDLNLDGVFVAIGHIPNSGFTNGLLTMDEVGYLTPQIKMPAESRTSKYESMSNVNGIFLAGDVEDKLYRQAITAAGNGCKAAMDLEKWLEEQGE